MESSAIEIGHRIRAARLRHGVTRRRLAESLGVSVSTVSRWERGVNPIPGDHIAALADALVVPISDIVRGSMDRQIRVCNRVVIAMAIDGGMDRDTIREMIESEGLRPDYYGL